MKKVIAVLAASVAMFFCAVTSHAQDVILTQDGDIIMAVVTEISDAEIVYKAFDNQEGPNYKIATSKVQKIRFVNGTEQTFATAQPAPQSDAPTAFQSADRAPSYNAAEVNRSGYMQHENGDFLLGGRTIYEGEYRNYFNDDEFETINGALKQRRAGKGITLAGAGCAGFGLGLMIPAGVCWAVFDYTNYTYYALLCTGAAFFSVGCTLLSVGIPLYCIGNGRLNWAADNYNQRNRMALDLTVSQYGPGLALRF